MGGPLEEIPGVEVTVVARRPCADPASAERLRRALVADSPAFVQLEVEGATLVLRTTATTARRARATLEDLLACVQAAERTVASSESK
ncbi:MAG TPA: KEOPS complex subunit Pcc1 [Thermoplasmata archaeon]|nr:KEOPS complex subunit Pcc1 [Thermoplasmata archaeon]